MERIGSRTTFRGFVQLMAGDKITALQAILIRERLILYVQHRRRGNKTFSVRQLIEAVMFSNANKDDPRINDAATNTGDRDDSGYPLKHNTIDNLLSRRTSAVTDQNLRLLQRFLVAEGLLSPVVIELCGEHPDIRLRRHFRGIALSDPRLQKYRRAIEGEYLHFADQTAHHVWIAAPGRSNPFLSVRAVTQVKSLRSITGLVKPITLDPDMPPLIRYEGRTFLMPGEKMILVEMNVAGKTSDCVMRRVGISADSLALQNDLSEPLILERTAPGVRGKERRLSFELVKYLLEQLMQHLRRQKRAFNQLVRIASRVFRLQTGDQAEKNMALIEAARSGTAMEVMLALLRGADINYQDAMTGRTAAHWAAASGILEKVYVLAVHPDDESQVLRAYFPDVPPVGDMADMWRTARAGRDPLIVDNEGCFASALAPASTDHSDRNRVATEIWTYLLKVECSAAGARYDTSACAFLDIWKPSSVMREAQALYSAKLPPGFSNPTRD